MERQNEARLKDRFNALMEYTHEFQSQRAVVFGQKFIQLNDPERAALAFKKAIHYDANNMIARLELSRALANSGRITEALGQIHQVFENSPTAERCVDITRTILQWAPRAHEAMEGISKLPEKPTVTMSLLGNDGRFGNQVYQYAFLRLYTSYHGFEYEVPSWIGQPLFGHSDPPLSSVLPLRMCTEGGLVPFQQPMGFDCPEPPKNVDLQGYFQHHTSVYRPFKEEFRSLFRPVLRIRSLLHEWVSECRRGCDTLIVAHFRFGDQSGTEYESKPEVCAEWLAVNWSRWRRPRLIVVSDDVQRAIVMFHEFSPYTVPAIDLRVASAGFYPDYFLMTQADVLLSSRSTFSFTAAMLNEVTNLFFRPTDDRSGITDFDPWNALS